MSHAYGDSKPDTAEERREKVAKVNLTLWDLVRSDAPWVLVEEGSILGYFDWVSGRCQCS